MQNYWILKANKGAYGCTVFYDTAGVLLDPTHWKWTTRYKYTQDMELEIQRQGKAEEFARDIWRIIEDTYPKKRQMHYGKGKF